MKAMFLISIGLAVVIPALALPGDAMGVRPAPLCIEQRNARASVEGFAARDDRAQPRADTTWYGGYEEIGGVYYARQGSSKAAVMWTFDRGDGPSGSLPPGVIENGEGWSVRDITANDALYVRVIDGTLDLGAGVSAPIIAGARSLWVGADKPQADVLCWPCGAGYGNNWCQRVVSEPLAYDGTGSVTLSMLYFNDSEECYDGTQIYLLRSDNTEYLLNPTPAGACAANPGFEGVGGFTDSIGGYTAPLTYNREITQAEIDSAQAIRFIIEMKSDRGYSDEDCDWETTYGPFGADAIAISGGGIAASYDFETGLQGWTPGFCNPTGAFVGIEDVSCYTILDPCACRLAGNVLEMHANDCNNNPMHPIGQHVQAYSPVCDLGDTSPKSIFMEFDMYAEMPRECGVLLRPGWRYFPWTCPGTGAQVWSPRVGQDQYNYFGTDPVCDTWRYDGTQPYGNGTPVPPDARRVVAVLELHGDCAAFTVDPCTCPGGNATPLFDNIAVGTTGAPLGPSISFDTGAYYMDCGSYPQTAFDPRGAVPANTLWDLYIDNPDKPDKAGDSLVVAGPLPGSDPNKRWEARMWWRVAKRGAFQADRAGGADTRYKIWKDRVSDGRLIDQPLNAQFTFGWMDSAQIGAVPQRNKFISSFREDDDDYRGEGNVETEMIWDDVLVPGTQIEYFITSNYVATPSNLHFYPDTSGGYFREFEALPGIRTANVPNCGGAGLNFCAYQPATLYIDFDVAGGRTAKLIIENALRSVLNGAPLCMENEGCPIPMDRNWDRFDYDDACGCWGAKFARNETFATSNRGMTLRQILGYRAILVNTGSNGAGATDEQTWRLFSRWLTSPECNGNVNRQVFVLNGDRAGEDLLSEPQHGAPFLRDVLQASLYCDAFNGFTTDGDCAPENTSFCVRLLPVAGGPFGTLTDVDAFGNYCPYVYGFNVFTPLAGGVGNRVYSAETPPKTMEYAQIVSANLGANANYKTVLDGVSWTHMTRRDPSPPGGDPLEYCPRDFPARIEAAYSEIAAALRWGFDVAQDSQLPRLANARDLAMCQGTWNLPSDVETPGDMRVNRLFQNEPNPFSARSTIRFTLAQTGPVEITIYDVNGRLVRILVDGAMEAGSHQLVWDGRNDAGHEIGAGIYWAQMKAGSFTSNKKMVILGHR